MRKRLFIILKNFGEITKKKKMNKKYNSIALKKKKKSKKKRKTLQYSQTLCHEKDKTSNRDYSNRIFYKKTTSQHLKK